MSVGVAGEQTRVDARAARGPTKNSRTAAPAAQLVRPRVEVGERPGEHDLGQHRVVPRRSARNASPTAARSARGSPVSASASKAGAEQPEALEEHLADEPGLVAEQLVDGRRRRPRLPRPPAGGEPGDPLARPASRPRPAGPGRAAPGCAASAWARPADRSGRGGRGRPRRRPRSSRAGVDGVAAWPLAAAPQLGGRVGRQVEPGQLGGRGSCAALGSSSARARPGRGSRPRPRRRARRPRPARAPG